MENNRIFSHVENNPGAFTRIFRVGSGEAVTFRPLLKEDVGKLTRFLEDLSPETREFSTFSSYDETAARELCDAIGRYDKLRFVLENGTGELVGLFEYSFDIPASDLERYEGYGMVLDSETDCRWGLTLSDAYQNKGLGSVVFPAITEIARNFGKKRIILYGGVLVANSRAIHFYGKHGFRSVGTFVNQDRKETVDMILDALPIS